ncbi:MAG: hypothetical protein N4A31_05860 [Rickettsiales bacterium]|jgi:hypothetical protein|nr:hypothetical protein [Rickettsiales bacterium]
MIQEEKHKNNPTSTIEEKSPSRQRSESTAGNDGTPVLTPDPNGERSPSPNGGFSEQETLNIIEEENRSGSESDDKGGESEHEDEALKGNDKKEGTDHKDGEEKLDHGDDGGESDHEGGDKESGLYDKKKGPDHEDDSGNGNTGGSPLGGTGTDAGYLLGGFAAQLTPPNGLHIPQIKFPNLAQITDQVTDKLPDPVKKLVA